MTRRRNPDCTHYDSLVGRVAWPTGMPEPGQSHASASVCAREACRRDAAAWVLTITGHAGVFVPFTRPQQQPDPSEPQLALFAEES